MLTLLLQTVHSSIFLFQDRGLSDTVRYVLPRLLYEPIYHCLEYFEYMKVSFVFMIIELSFCIFLMSIYTLLIEQALL